VSSHPYLSPSRLTSYLGRTGELYRSLKPLIARAVEVHDRTAGWALPIQPSVALRTRMPPTTGAPRLDGIPDELPTRIKHQDGMRIRELRLGTRVLERPILTQPEAGRLLHGMRVHARRTHMQPVVGRRLHGMPVRGRRTRTQRGVVPVRGLVLVGLRQTRVQAVQVDGAILHRHVQAEAGAIRLVVVGVQPRMSHGYAYLLTGTLDLC
jgi:hypothetical protein